MNRSSLIISCIVLAILGAGLFHVAQEVRDYEAKLASIHRDIEHERNNIHILRTEWSYLTQPARLEKLAKKHTDLQPMTGRNLVAIYVVPFQDDFDDNNNNNEFADHHLNEGEGDDAVLDSPQQTKTASNPPSHPSGYKSYISKTTIPSSTQSSSKTVPIKASVSLHELWGTQ